MWRPRHGVGGFRVWALGLSLLILLASIGGLAYQAVGLDRSHRAVAEGVLRDYSAFAADQFSRLALDQIRSLTATMLQPVACGLTSDVRFAAAAERTPRDAAPPTCSGANPTAVDGYFEIDPATARVVFTTGSVGNEILEVVANLRSESSFAFDLLPGPGPARVVGYLTDLVPGGQKRVVGFVAPAAIVQPIFERIIQHERLLPGSLAEPAQNRENLTVDVRAVTGASIYHSGESVSAFSTERPVGSPAGRIRVHLGINDAAAGRLIIGGVPRSRLPLLISLLLVAVALLTIGTWQVHRERRLAAMRVDFVRSASHELRTPLAQIRLFTETLQLGRVRSWSEVLRSLAFVDQQTRRLSRLVENFLTFADGGERRRGNLEHVELARFLTETVGAFQPIAHTLGQCLRVDVTESCTVRADREWLTQVMLNLLDNATKYGPTGQNVTVAVGRDDAHVRITIEDQGPGIPAGDRRRIFAPFVRLSREHEHRTGGTGIGLSVASELMVAMNGRLWVEDAATSGARFVVELPLVPSNVVQTIPRDMTSPPADDEARSHVA